jgi:radical SAM protein with 4Fe4S-binding SPASM domain
MPALKEVKKKILKIANKLPITEKEFKFLESVLEKRFLNFGVEPTNLCDARCPYCPYRFSKEAKKVMPLDLYKKAIEQYDTFGGGGLALTPTIGEPLMDKTIINKIRIARSYPSIRNIFFYTNLLNLNQFDVKELLTSGISRISVSTTIGSRDMYFRLCGVDKYDLLFANLIKLLETNKSLINPVNIILALRVDKTFDLYNNNDYKKILSLIDEKKITQIPSDRGYDNWGGIIEEKHLPEKAIFRQSKKDKSEPCAELYRRINVLANGDVNFCVCRDYNYEMIIGNIHKEDMLTIWRGRVLNALRDNWKQGKMPKICENCTMYKPLSEFLTKSRIAIWALWRRTHKK